MVTLTSKPSWRAASLALVACAGLSFAAVSRAADAVAIPVPGAPPAASSAAPTFKPYVDARIHHAPTTRAAVHETLRVIADVEDPHLAKQIVLVYRAADGAFREVPFLLGKEHWIAEIPAEDVVSPSLAYTIEIVRLDGTRATAFASRAAPFVVDVPEDLDDLRERAWLARLGGRRSEAMVMGEVSSFGDTTQVVVGGQAPQLQSVHDYYLRTDATYTYRPLRDVVEFGVRLGIARGNTPRPPGDTQSVGLNYGSANVTFALLDGLAVTLEGLTSVTENGFSGGGGAEVHIGDFFGEKLVLGVESIKTFGTRGWARLDLAHRDQWRVSPIIELTDMPHAELTALRLMIEAAGRIGMGFSVVGRVSYQARDFHSGGPGLGLALAYGF